MSSLPPGTGSTVQVQTLHDGLPSSVCERCTKRRGRVEHPDDLRVPVREPVRVCDLVEERIGLRGEPASQGGHGHQASPPGLVASSETLFTPYLSAAFNACSEMNLYGLDRMTSTTRPADSTAET